jgi:hypothetical protein
MAEYIEREAVLAKAIYVCEDGYDGADMVLVKHIEEAPAADVAPVRHGRWEARKDVPGFVNCSVCHDCNIYDDWADGKKWKYCPDCGAKMDLEGGGGDGQT